MSSQWKFQLIPSKKDALGEGFRMDSVAEKIEKEVNEALPYRFKFHKIGKIVIWLGPRHEQPDYEERMGVALKLYENFNATEYMQAPEALKIAMLRKIIQEVFAWFLDSFEDSEFINVAKNKVPWLVCGGRIHHG